MFEFLHIEEVKRAIQEEQDTLWHYDKQWFSDLRYIPRPESDDWGLTDAVATLAARYSQLLLGNDISEEDMYTRDHRLYRIGKYYGVQAHDHTFALKRNNRIWAIEKVISFQDRLLANYQHHIHTIIEQ